MTMGKSKPSAKQRTGQRGETLATEFLIQAGWVIVERNWRCASGEIDIIAKDGETLIFVEVRTRHSANTEPNFESFTPRKRAKMIATSDEYLSTHQLEDSPYRIDAIAISFAPHSAPIIEHIPDVLNW